MLCAGKVGLRARDEADVAILHAELYEDIVTYMTADSRPWRPIPAGSSASPYAIGEPGDDLALFSVVELARGELAGGELAGAALLWAIDLHNRTAHLGLSLRPSFRGRGLGQRELRRRGDPRAAGQRLGRGAVTRAAAGRAEGPRERTARGSRARRTAR